MNSFTRGIDMNNPYDDYKPVAEDHTRRDAWIGLIIVLSSMALLVYLIRVMVKEVLGV